MKTKEIIKNPVLYLILVWVIVSVSFIFTIITDDLYVFYAYARQVSLSDQTGLDAILSTWEIKGLLARITYYFLYAITNVFSSEFTIWTWRIYKLFGWIFANVILAGAVYLMPEEKLKRAKKPVAFLITSIILSAVHYISHLQPEYFVVPLFLLSTALVMRKKWYLQVIAGFLLVCTFFYKSPALILSGTLFFFIMLDEKLSLWPTIKRTYPLILSSFVFLFISLACIKFFYPQEITDILDASHYQHTLLQSDSFTKAFRTTAWCMSEHFMTVMYYFPILLVVIYSFISYCRNYTDTKHQNAELLLIALLFFFPLAYVILSFRFTHYHYYLLMYPSVLYLYVMKDQINTIKENIWDKRFLAILLSVIVLSIVATFSPKIYRITGEYRYVGLYLITILAFVFADAKWHKREWAAQLILLIACYVYITSISAISLPNKHTVADTKRMIELNTKEGFPIGAMLGNGEILYLDDGTGAFLFSNKSYLRYFYPLPIQRIAEDEAFAQSETYISTYKKLLSYTGEYIVYDDEYMGRTKHPQIEQLISDNYTKDTTVSVVFTTGYWLNFYSMPHAETKEITILIRNNAKASL